MGCGNSVEASNSPSDGVAGKLEVAKFENGRPAVKYDEIYGCFVEKEVGGLSSDEDENATTRSSQKNKKKSNHVSPPGKLFRLVHHDKRTWYFYNDTSEFNMVVTGYFGAMNHLKVRGPTRMWREVPSGLVIAELVVPPLQTEAYVEGLVNDGFDLRFKALPVD